MPTEKAIRDWFDSTYAEKGLRSMRSYEAYPVFLDYLSVQAGKKLLDVGCGTGFLLKEATRRGLRTFGVDFSNEAVKLSKAVSPESHISVAKGEDLGFRSNSFHYVTCNATLEHLLSMENGLSEIRRVAKGDARFCIMVPNSRSPMWKLEQKLGTVEEDSNENPFSREEWSSLLLKNGFEILKVFRDRWWTKKVLLTMSLQSFGILDKWAGKVFRPLVPLEYAYQFIFILRKDRSDSTNG